MSAKPNAKPDVPAIPGGDKPVEGPIGRIWEGSFQAAFSSMYPWKKQDSQDSRRAATLAREIEEKLFPEVDASLVEREKSLPLSAIQRMVELGLFRLKVPENLGGIGLKQWGYNDILGLLGAYSSALAAYGSAHNTLGLSYPLCHYGTEEQKKLYLETVMSSPTGFCFTERSVGSDPGSMQTRAERVRNSAGEVIGYRLNGEKWYTTNALRAKLLAVVANTVEPGQDSSKTNRCFSIFVVPTDAPGVDVGPANYFAGMYGIDNANPKFKDVFIPVGARIGDEGKGFNVALEALNAGRIAVGAIVTAAVRQALCISRTWAGKRDQRGLIGNYELIQEKLVKMTAELYAMETLIQFAAKRSDDGLDASVEAAISKVFATEKGWEIIDDMVQIRGGRGYETDESLARREEYHPPVERIWRDLRVARIFEGSSEVLTLWSSARGLYAYLQIAKGAKGMLGQLAAGIKLLLLYGKSLMPTKISGNVHPSLQEHLKYAERMTRRFARKIIASSLKYQNKMQHKQLLIDRMFWISARLLTVGLTVSRATASGNREEVELANLYGKLSKLEIDRLFREWDTNADALMRPYAKKILEGNYSFLEELTPR